MKYFHRQIVDPVDLNPDEQINPDWDRISDRKRIHEGVTMTGRLSLGSLLVEANIQNVTVTDGNQELRFLPPWSGTGGVYYRDKLFENHLDLKTGIRGRAFSAYRASGFEQQRQISDAVTPGAESGTVATIDLLFIAHLGDATIHFVWENFLDRQYVMTYLYPMPDRAIRFGLSWEFTD